MNDFSGHVNLRHVLVRGYDCDCDHHGTQNRPYESRGNAQCQVHRVNDPDARVTRT